MVFKFFTKQAQREILISKFIDDLPGCEDVLVDPRSYSPDRLKEVCNNIKFSTQEEIDPIENLTLQFIFRNFFFLMHQTGLYNPQRRFFNQIASTSRVEIKDFSKLSEEFKKIKKAGRIDIDSIGPKISDLFFYDIHNKYLQIRLEHPSIKPDVDSMFFALNSLFSEAQSNKCAGVMYISNHIPSDPMIEMIRSKTKYDDQLERYSSPLNGQEKSFNLLNYQANAQAVEYSLIHPQFSTKDIKASIDANLLGEIQLLVGV